MSDDMPTREELSDTRRRCDSYASANIAQATKLDKLRDELDHLKLDRERLGKELVGERQNNQFLITDGNGRYQTVNDEVERLRQLCKANGINPNEG